MILFEMNFNIICIFLSIQSMMKFYRKNYTYFTPRIAHELTLKTDFFVLKKSFIPFS